MSTDILANGSDLILLFRLFAATILLPAAGLVVLALWRSWENSEEV